MTSRRNSHTKTEEAPLATFNLKDTARTTTEEREVYALLEPCDRTVWCPIRDHQLDAVVCARLQNDRRRRCRRVHCVNLDSPSAKALRKARKMADKRSGQPCMKFA
jgi:hypothetical protein